VASFAIEFFSQLKLTCAPPDRRR